MTKVKKVSYSKWGYIFAAPFIIAFALFMLYPLVYTLVLGFTDLSGMQAMAANEWNLLDDPLENFKNVLQLNLFRVSLVNTFKIWVINFIPQMLLALLLTAWFTKRRNKFRGQSVFKVLFYMPNIITAASIAILFNALVMAPAGPVNYLLKVTGILDEPFYFMNSTTASPLIVAFIQFWMWYGYTMLILISGVLGLNPEMYEAAEVDGANNVQQFFKITLPNLRTILLFTLVTSMVGGLNMFDVPKLFNDGGPVDSTYTLAIFIYNRAFGGRFFYNQAAAASIIVFIIIAILAMIIFFAMRDRDAAREKRDNKRLLKARKAADKAAEQGGVA